MNGTILGIVDKQIVYQNNSTKPNRNIFVVGGPGSYKTQSVVITNLFNETENSIVVTDPKGELYEKTAGIKLAQGYQVHVVNLQTWRIVIATILLIIFNGIFKLKPWQQRSSRVKMPKVKKTCGSVPNGNF